MSPRPSQQMSSLPDDTPSGHLPLSQLMLYLLKSYKQGLPLLLLTTKLLSLALKRLSPAKHQSMLDSAWLFAPALWDICQEGNQWQAFVPQPSSEGSQVSQLVPDFKVK